MTLCFLGPRPAEDVAAIGAIVEEQVVPVPRLALADAVWLPPRRPGVLAVTLADPDGALGALQARLAAALIGRGWYAPERRAFLPHVTVARVRRGRRLRGEALATPGLEAFAGPTVTLYASHPGAAGARYEALARARLER